jgi:cysteine-rich repeat protein
MYAGTAGGIFKTTNGGSSWAAINSGLTTTDVNAVAVDPLTPSTIYAGTTGGGIFKTTTAGTSWTAVNTGLTNTVVVALAVDPQTPSTAYAGTDGGVFKTTTGGSSWAAANGGLTNTTVRALAVDPTTPATIYAGTWNGVFKTTTGGASWSAINSGGLAGSSVHSLAIDPTTPTTVYAGTVFSSSRGVFKTTTAGTSWAVMANLIDTDVPALLVAPTSPSTLYAGTIWGGVYVFSPVCGDTVIDAGEQCDDGNTLSGDSCSATCQLETTPTPTATATPTATPTVSATPTATVTATATAVETVTPTPTETITPTPSATATATSAATPTATPTPAICGNAVQEPAEECDDGNTDPSDGCSATCTLEPCVAMPVPGCLDAAQAQIQANEKTAGKEKLKLQWKKVAAATTQAQFGDPVDGATRVALCLYDDGNALIRGWVIDRAGQPCGAKPCWSAKLGKSYAYKDAAAAADGITKIGYGAGGPGKGKVDAAGANNAGKGHVALPTGVAAALAGNTHPTIQVVTSDGLCIGATMTDVVRDDGSQYQARKK